MKTRAASSTLDDIPPATRVFVDSTIFVYHFTEASLQCRRLLERCQRREVEAVSSVVVLAEVAHRLMMVEAVRLGHVKGANVPKKLREREDLVRGLHLYQEAVDRIPLMGVTITGLDLATWLRSKEARERYGLLVNDSLVVAGAESAGAAALASADADFERIGGQGLALYRPGDLG